GRAARPERRRQVDHHRHAARPETPDSGSVSLFGRAPDAAIQDGAIGAMLQTGSLIRDLSVRELIAMMGSLYPHPLPVEDVIDMVGIGSIAGRRIQKLSN